MGVAAMLTATGAAYADVTEDVVDFMGYEVPLRDSEMTIEWPLNGKFHNQSWTDGDLMGILKLTLKNGGRIRMAYFTEVCYMMVIWCMYNLVCFNHQNCGLNIEKVWLDHEGDIPCLQQHEWTLDSKET